MNGQELLKFQKDLIDLNNKIKELTEQKQKLSQAVMEFLKMANKDRIKSPIGTSYIMKRKTYKYTEEIEAMNEEIKLAKKEEEAKALTPEEWEALQKQYIQDPANTDMNVPFYKESETLAFREAKPETLKDEITIK